MQKQRNKKQIRQVVKARIRRKLSGTAERPRLAVFRSLRHIYVQAVDDTTGCTIAQASTRDTDMRGAYGGNVLAATDVGTRIAARVLEKGCKAVVFDRSGYIYHGRIKALAQAARAKGLEF